MSVLKNFDMSKLMKERAKAAQGSTDLVAELGKISKDYERLDVGETAKVKIPDGVSTRKFAMSVTAKLTNLIGRGQPWAGRTFKTVAGPDGYLYTQRGPDLPKNQIPVRTRKPGAGRPKKVAAETPAAEAPVTVDTGSGPEQVEQTQEPTAEKQEGARVIEHA